MTEEFTSMIKDILDKAGLDISVQQIEAGLSNMEEKIPVEDPGLKEVISKIEAEYQEKGGPSEEGYPWKGKGEYRVMSGLVDLEFRGRARKKYHGDAILMIKPDDSLVVHGIRGVNPVCYVARADRIQLKGKDGKLTITAVAGSDCLVVTFLKMTAFETLFRREQLENAKSPRDMWAGEEIVLTDDEKALEARLRKLRIELAHRDGISFLPAVYDNRTMHQLVRHRPKTIEELKQVKGFGAKRIERYAASVLEAINSGEGDQANA